MFSTQAGNSIQITTYRWLLLVDCSGTAQMDGDDCQDYPELVVHDV